MKAAKAHQTIGDPIDAVSAMAKNEGNLALAMPFFKNTETLRLDQQLCT